MFSLLATIYPKRQINLLIYSQFVKQKRILTEIHQQQKLKRKNLKK
jgi:hypothetical protein